MQSRLISVSVLSLLGAVLLQPGVTPSDARPRSCTGDLNKCMNDCPGSNAEAKNPKLATEACRNNCGRQWVSCSYSGRDDSSLQTPKTPKSGVPGVARGTATAANPSSPPKKESSSVAKPGGGGAATKQH